MLFRIYISIIIAFYVFVSFFPAFAEQKTLEQEVSNIMQKAKEMKVPDLKENRRAEEEAQKAYNFTLTEEFLNAVKQHKKTLEQIINPDFKNSEEIFETYYSEYGKKQRILNPDERIYIFVSSSMPDYTIRRYVSAVHKLGDPNIYFVLRGFIGGVSQMTPTVKWIHKNIKKDSLCEDLSCELYSVRFIVDPFLYSKYDITAVPAVVYVKGLKNELLGSEGLNSVKVDNFWVSYGDVSLEYHLKLIGEKSGKNFNIKE